MLIDKTKEKDYWKYIEKKVWKKVKDISLIVGDIEEIKTVRGDFRIGFSSGIKIKFPTKILFK